MIIITILVIICVILLILYSTRKEGYNMGTIVQLQAKGPQDTYLSDDAWKYLYLYPYGHINPRYGKKKWNRYVGSPAYIR